MHEFAYGTSLHMYVLVCETMDFIDGWMDEGMHPCTGWLDRLVCPPLVDPSISLSLSVYSSYQYICYICLRAKNYPKKEIIIWNMDSQHLPESLDAILHLTFAFRRRPEKKKTSCNLMYENSSVLQLVPPQPHSQNIESQPYLTRRKWFQMPPFLHLEVCSTSARPWLFDIVLCHRRTPFRSQKNSQHSNTIQMKVANFQQVMT